MASEAKEVVLSTWKRIYEAWKNHNLKSIDESDLRYRIIAYHTFHEIVDSYADWIAHNGKKIDCTPDTQKIYKDCYECTYRTLKREKEEKMRQVICQYNNSMDEVLEEFGIGRVTWGDNISYRVTNLNKFFLKVWDEYLDKRIQELGIKGLKLRDRKKVTCNSCELFDFKDAEFGVTETKEE